MSGWKVKHMPNNKNKDVRTKPSRPAVAGIGLTALDVIWEQESRQYQVAAGGTCGNVLCILAYFGWKSSVISRLAWDVASGALEEDLKKWGVETKSLHLKPNARTPVIIEKVKKDSSGVPFHTFSFNCPGCGGRLPQFQPVVSEAVPALTKKIAKTDVLFIDRVSRSAITLARSASENGAVVFFEPSASSNPKQLAELLELSHIVKYSHDRVKDTGELDWGANTHLQIQTFGRGGLQFRTNLANKHRSAWRSVPAVPVSGGLRDAAGAGDWLSAVLINRLCRDGIRQLRRTKFDDLLAAINFGQAVAAWNCSFLGPRGSMYALSRSQFWSQLNELQRGKAAAAVVEPSGPWETVDLPQEVCSICFPKRGKIGGTFAA